MKPVEFRPEGVRLKKLSKNVSSSEIEACYYSENPSCNDGIKNCHDGSCELLVDCGGPCSPCPSCSDDIQNQNEEGVDCGGPCPQKCSVETPQMSLKNFSLKNITLFVQQNLLYSFSLLIVVILMIIVIIKGIKIIKLSGKLRRVNK